jgi:hypothetical protein
MHGSHDAKGAALLPLAAWCVFTFGCAEPPETHAGYSVSDSAGIRIAANDIPLETLRLVVAVVPEQVLRIGVESGDASVMFNRIRDVTRLESGHFVIVDETQELRVFDSTGKHVVTYGGQGQGPGEFLSVSDIVAQAADTMLVWDRRAMRYSTFSVSGGFVDRAVTRRRNLSDLLIKDYFYEQMYPASDGSLIVQVDARMDPQEKEAGRAAGVFSRLPATLVWVNPEFTSYRKLGEHGGIHQVKANVAGTPEYFVSPNGFWPHQSVGGTPPRICVDALSGPQVNCFDADGQATFIRWSMEVPQLPAGTVSDWIEAEARRGSSGHRSTPEQIRAALSSLKVPSEMASVHGITVDALGMVWVRSPDTRPADGGRPRFRIFSREGELIGYAELTVQQVMEIGENYTTAVVRNADGVERVEIHRLSRQR